MNMDVYLDRGDRTQQLGDSMRTNAVRPLRLSMHPPGYSSLTPLPSIRPHYRSVRGRNTVRRSSG